MNNINNDNVENTASLSFTETQMEELYQQFAQRLRAEQDERRRGEVLDLPEEITSELNNASRSDIQSNIKKYQRDVQKYEGGDWTKSPTINKSYIQDLKRYQVDAKQVVSYRHDDSEKLRVAGRAAAEIYQELLFLTESGGDYESIQQTIEKCRRLSIYGFACSSEIDREARALAIKSLRLPQSARHLEDDEVEGDNKKMVFSADVVEQINQARYEHQIIRSAVASQHRGYNNGNRGRGGGFFRGSQYGQRGRGFTQKPFFGRGRGVGRFSPENPSNQSNHNQA